MNRPKTRTREERVFPLTVEVRAGEGDDPARIVGHAAVFNRWSEDLGGFVERIMPGAFAKTIGEADIRSLFNHDPNFVLGRTKSGTLTLSEDKKGLLIDAVAPETDTIRDLVLAPMERGDVDQASFSFRTIRDEWRDPDAKDNKHGKAGLWERDLLEVGLYDVGPVTFPAYTQTDMGVRSLIDVDGFDLQALAAVLIRAERGIPLTEADIELLTGSIDALRGHLPSEPEPIAATTPDEPQAGRSVVHLRRLLDIRERELSLTA